jgi:hypothetical protein
MISGLFGPHHKKFLGILFLGSLLMIPDSLRGVAIKYQVSRLALKIVVMARQEALMQEARVKRFWEILLFFTYL